MVYTPSTLKELCQRYGFSPSKAYGQNYLISEKPITAMIAAANIQKEDVVIEIGPGFGMLTHALAPVAKKVICFEIEKQLQPYWDEHAPTNVDIIWGNALHHLASITKELQRYKVVANVPYQITSQLLRVLLELDNPPEDIVVMVQKEVAERMCDAPGSMSMLAVSVQYYGAVSVVMNVTKGNFWPMPKVHSAVVHIKIKKSDYTKEQEAAFFRLVKVGFSNKRKQLRHNIMHAYPIDDTTLRKILHDISGSDMVRAQELSIDQWKQLTSALQPYHQ